MKTIVYLRLSIILLVAGIFPYGLSHAQLIDTTVIPNLTSGPNLGPYGQTDETYGGIATFGQTFRVDSEFTILDTWTFYGLNWLSPWSPGSTEFSMYVMDWEIDRGIGEILYESPVVSSDLSYFRGDQEFTFHTGGVPLNPNNDYVAFFSASKYFDESPGQIQVRYVYNGVDYRNGSYAYTDGDFVELDNRENTDAWSTEPWTVVENVDLVFRARFSSGAAVPEPSTYGLMGIVALVVLIIFRRFKK